MTKEKRGGYRMNAGRKKMPPEWKSITVSYLLKPWLKTRVDEFVASLKNEDKKINEGKY